MKFTDLPAEVRQQTLSYLLPQPRTSSMLVVCPCLSDRFEEARWDCGCFNDVSLFWPSPAGPTNIAWLTCPDIVLASRTTLEDIHWLRRTSSLITEITACSVACAYNFLASQSNATGARLTSVTIEDRIKIDILRRMPFTSRRVLPCRFARLVDMSNGAQEMLERFYPDVEKVPMPDLSPEWLDATEAESFTRRIGVSVVPKSTLTKSQKANESFRRRLLGLEEPMSTNSWVMRRSGCAAVTMPTQSANAANIPAQGEGGSAVANKLFPNFGGFPHDSESDE